MKKLVLICCIIFLSLSGCSSTEKVNSNNSKRVNQQTNNHDKKENANVAKSKVVDEGNNTKPSIPETGNKEEKKTDCPINTPDKAEQAVKVFMKAENDKDLTFSTTLGINNTYNVKVHSQELAKQGGTGTAGIYIVDMCSKEVRLYSELIPNEMVGVWSGTLKDNKKIEYILTNTTITYNGKSYQIDICDEQSTNDSITHYSISWKLGDFKKQYGYLPAGPQPFLLSYNAGTDTLIVSGTILKRVSK